MKRKRSFEKTLLIVCEGSKTEPNYFETLKKTALEQEIWSKIAIFPTLIIEENITKQANKRRKRNFKPNEHEDNHFKNYLMSIYPAKNADKIYEQNKSVPTRFVKEAQIKLEQEGFDEAWAVFDKDGHPAAKNAFDLAKKAVMVFGEEKFVKIAFSSIAFEQWILLHFEKNKMAYAKSKDLIDCELIAKKYLPIYEKKETLLANQLSEKQIFALENAVWLRFQICKISPKIPIYELNPYTNIDVLVKTILNIQTEYVWIDLDTEYNFKDLNKLKINLLDAYTVKLSFQEIKINPLINFNFWIKNATTNPIKLEISENSFSEINQQGFMTIKCTYPLYGYNLSVEYQHFIIMTSL